LCVPDDRRRRRANTILAAGISTGGGVGQQDIILHIKLCFVTLYVAFLAGRPFARMLKVK